MSRCRDCGCYLPDSQAHCKGCHDTRYAEGGHPIRAKSFGERLTRPNVLLFLGTFTFGFLEFRFDTSDYFPFNVFLRYRYHLMPTKTAALTALVLGSIASTWRVDGEDNLAEFAGVTSQLHS